MENLDILSREETSKKITSIAKKSTTLRADINQCARSCFVHAAEHGDLTLATRLLNATSKSYHADLKRYFTTFGPIHFSKDKGFTKSRKGGTWNMTALDVSFDMVEKAEKSPAEYDRAKELASIIKFLDTKADRAIAACDSDMAGTLVDIAAVLAGLIGK